MKDKFLEKFVVFYAHKYIITHQTLYVFADVGQIKLIKKQSLLKTRVIITKKSQIAFTQPTLCGGEQLFILFVGSPKLVKIF